MRLRSFDARTMSEAMARVRAELGPEAILVSTEKHPGGVRVTAAVEPVDPVEAELPDPLEAVHEALVNHGVLPRLTEKLLAAASGIDAERPALALGAALDERFDFAPVAPGRPVMLVGPPGAGKTVSTAKLATKAVLDGMAVRVVSTDTVRAGAVEQLEAFTRLLGIGLHRAETPQELAAAVADPAEDELVLVDTGGINPYLAGDRDELAALAAGIEAELVFVVAAGGDVYDTVEMARVFGELGCRRLIATRLDMVHRLGALLAAAEAAGLAFAGVGIGPSIAEGFATLTPLSLARLLLSEPEPAAPRFHPETEAVPT